MEEDNKHQLVKFENSKILEIINSIPHLTNEDRQDLSKKLASNQIELQRSVLEKISQSHIAQDDLANIQSYIAALDKKDVYVKTKQTIKTGSGQVDIEMRGGDRKLIIPVLTIVGIVIIAVIAIIFWK